MSHITVPAEKVIKCCENWITYNNIRRCQRAAEMLKKEAAKKSFGFFGKPIGYQKAYETLQKPDYFGPSFQFSAVFWEDESWETVKNLLTLAKNGDPVIISVDHAFIFNFEDITFEPYE